VVELPWLRTPCVLDGVNERLTPASESEETTQELVLELVPELVLELTG
jgi:hypothetical protein